jgi:uncharacterized protein YaeQ
MALKSTIYKAELTLTDMDRAYFQTHALTLARHPSETDERLMIRLLAFAMYASDRLQFSKDLSVDDEPALWEHQRNGDCDLWIELGLPDEKRLRRANHRANQAVLFAYGKGMAIWLKEQQKVIRQLDKLQLVCVSPEDSLKLQTLCQRNMQLQFTFSEGDIFIHSEQGQIDLELKRE